MSGLGYAALRAALSMEQVLTLLDYRPTQRRGPQLRGPCPIHDLAAMVDRRCFSVHLDRHAFRCFRCGAHGNQLDLWRLVHRLPLYQAALHLCRQAGLTPPRLPPHPTQPQPEIRNLAVTTPRQATD
jgi:DNA primase